MTLLSPREDLPPPLRFTFGCLWAATRLENRANSLRCNLDRARHVPRKGRHAHPSTADRCVHRIPNARRRSRNRLCGRSRGHPLVVVDHFRPIRLGIDSADATALCALEVRADIPRRRLRRTIERHSRVGPAPRPEIPTGPPNAVDQDRLEAVDATRDMRDNSIGARRPPTMNR
jgi:hypothetical protein